MNFFERLKQLTEAIFTYRYEVRNLKERQDEDRKDVFELSKEVNRLAALVQTQGERIARIEAARDADRAQFSSERAERQSDMTRFQYEVDRALLKINAARGLPQITAAEDDPTL